MDTVRSVEHEDARQHHCQLISVKKQTLAAEQVSPASPTTFANLLLDVARNAITFPSYLSTLTATDSYT
jgi:hypothetical protein